MASSALLTDYILHIRVASAGCMYLGAARGLADGAGRNAAGEAIRWRANIGGARSRKVEEHTSRRTVAKLRAELSTRRRKALECRPNGGRLMEYEALMHRDVGNTIDHERPHSPFVYPAQECLPCSDSADEHRSIAPASHETSQAGSEGGLSELNSLPKKSAGWCGALGQSCA